MSAWLPIVAGAGSALVGGFYLAFSSVVMPALRNRPATEAAATMVTINQQAMKPPFMILYFGSAAACAAVVVTAVVEPLTHSPLRVVGAAACLAGWASTIAVNVPLNNRLSEEASSVTDLQWRSYLRYWAPANHIRAALSIAGAVGLLIPQSGQ